MKYKLKKEMPCVPAGTVFDEAGMIIERVDDSSGQASWVASAIKATRTDTAWFEPLPEAPTRWRAKRGDWYFVLVLSDYNGTVNSSQEQGDSYDNSRHETGNYFKTKEQAETVSTAIKSLLEYVHTPIEGHNSSGKPSPSKDYDDPNYINLADQARQAVQKDAS